MRFLIVDNEARSYLPLKRFLEEEAFAVDHVKDALKATNLIRLHSYDILLIASLAEGTGGPRLCASLRQSGCALPIIGLAPNRDLETRLEYFLAGADDCLSQGYSVKELLARVRAVSRRGPALQKDILKAAGVVMNCQTQRVRAGGRLVSLSKKEYALLELLMRNTGAIVARSVILEHVWDLNQNAFSNTVEAHICTLRKKLGARARKAIQNIQGRGYLIDP